MTGKFYRISRLLFDKDAGNVRNALVAAAVIIAVTLIAAAFIVPFIYSWSNDRSTDNVPTPPKEPPPFFNSPDQDGDGLCNTDEMERYGTDPFNPDTDGDGMWDGWEVHYRVKDNLTGKWLLDPKDPTNVYEDPDNDGYDFNHNGYIDGSSQDPNYSGSDAVFLSGWKSPSSPNYTAYNLSQLLLNQGQYRGNPVRVQGARVVENGTYEIYGKSIYHLIIFNLTSPVDKY